MFDSIAKLALAVALAGAAAPSLVLADSGDDQYAVAAGHYARDRWQLAVTEFQTFRTKYPRHAKFNQAMFFEAEAQVQLGQFEDAIKLFAEFVKRDPKNRFHRQALFRWGESNYLRDDHAAARPLLEEFRQSYSKDKLNAYVLAYLGQIALKAKDYAAARDCFNASLSQFPESHAQDECRFGMARVAEEEGDARTAERLYLALGGKTASAWADDAQLRLGGLKYAEGNYADAISALEAFETTFKQSELVDRARLSRGWALFKLDELDKARAIFESLQQSPAVGLEARYWLGLTQKAQKDYAAAAETLTAASQTNARHELVPEIVFHAADALARAGQRDAARQQYDRLLTTWPENAWADNALLGKLQLSLTTANHPQVDELAAQFDKQFAKSELATEARRIHAQSLLARKEFDKAAALLKPSADAAKAPSLADQYLLAATRQGLAQHEEALAALAPVLQSAEGQLLADARLLQAAILVAQGKHADAIPPLEAHLAADPQGIDSARCRAQLATCYARGDKLAEARRIFTDLQGQQPADDLRRSATQQLAEAVFAAGDHAWSAELFQSLASAEEPAEVAARGLSGLGWSRYKAGELEAAAAAFALLLDRYPQSNLAAEAALVSGQILERLKKPAEALARYRLLIEKHPQDERLPQALLGAARLFDQLDQNEEAAAHYARLIKEFPEHESFDTALYEGGWVLRELNRNDQSDQQFQTIHDKHRQSRYWPDATFRLAERACAAKRYEDAQKLLAELIEAKVGEKLLPHVQYLQGQAAVGQQQWAKVIEVLQPLTEASDDSPYKLLARYWTAEAFYRQGDYPAAGERLADLAQHVEDSRDPWTAMVPLRRAQIFAHQKKWKEAHELATQIATRWPAFDQQHEADYVIGRVLAARGEFDDARAAYERVIQSKTGGKTETAAMAQWMIGESYFHQQSYETALREYLRLEILYAYPTWQAAALLQAGKCSEHLNQWKQAADLYQRVVKEFPETRFVEEAQMRLIAARERLANR